MAARHIRRLQEQLNASKAAEEAQEAAASGDRDASGDEDVSSEDGGGGDHAKPFNPFDLLSDDEESDASEDSENASEGGEEAAEPEAQAAAKQPPPAQARKQQPGKAPPKQQQQQQQGSKKQQQQQQQQPSAPASKAGGAGKAGKGKQRPADDDIDRLLQELDMAPAAPKGAGAAAAAAAAGSSSSTGSAARAGPPRPALLGVDPKRIRGDEELRRIFGAGVIEAVDRMEGGSYGRRGGGAAASGRAAVRRRQLKKVMLVTPAEHWPHVDSGISMRQAGTTPDGKQLFVYVWSPNYAAAQRVFEQAQASYDPNAVGAVLAQFPYHVDSLLAMNELYRSMGEAQTADDFLCRALYALEGAWCHGFDPAAANVRLDFTAAPNRGLFLALFRHAQGLSRRGCHASALEVTKLLLALDPEDPVGGLLLLDYLALRAGAFDYLERFVSEFDSSHSLALLPNYAFALPMARFRLEQAAAAAAAAAQQQQQQGGGAAARKQQQGQGQQAAAAAASSGGVSSLTLLAQALLLHPLVLRELLDKLQGAGAAREEAWQELRKRRLYAKASDHGSSSLGHLISLFVERSHQLWKPADALAWLRVAATAAADVADGASRSGGAAAAAAAGAGAGGSASSGGQAPAAAAAALPLPHPDAVVVEGSAEDWACVARESFPPAPRNEYGHLRLADFSDAVNALPAEEVQGMVGGGGGAAGGGPGRPMDQAAALEVLNDMLEQEQVAAVMAAAQRAQQQQGGGPAVPAEQLQGANPLLVLLQTLLPWVNAGQQPDYAAPDAGAGGGGGAGAGAGGGQQQQQQGPPGPGGQQQPPQ